MSAEFSSADWTESIIPDLFLPEVSKDQILLFFLLFFICVCEDFWF